MSQQANGLDPNDYEQDADGLLRQPVGPWVREKHERVRRYVGISGAARRKYLGPRKAGATYIDLFCGPGKVRVRNTTEVAMGSPLIAWTESKARSSGFSSIHVSDANSVLAQAATARLKALGAPAAMDVGPAEEVVERLVERLHPAALHFAFLDPYSLTALPFTVIQRLATLERMDILIHFSTQDLNRNLRHYVDRSPSPLDRFAPGWRKAVGDFNRSDAEIRGRIFEHWRNLLKGIDMQTAEAAELIAGENNQPLYWLAFAARHPLALGFWEKIRHPGPQTGSLFEDQ